jgi:hypothetical protein
VIVDGNAKEAGFEAIVDDGIAVTRDDKSRLLYFSPVHNLKE